MADAHDFPPELVELRIQLLDADDAWAAAGRDREASPDTVTAAYRRVQALTHQLHDHAWLRTAGNTHDIRTALRKTAQEQRATRDA